MGTEKTIKEIGLEENLEEKIVLAVRSIVDQFSERIPDKIVLKNSNNSLFKKVLEEELTRQNYNVSITDFEEKNPDGYVIDVREYLNQEKYPRKFF